MRRRDFISGAGSAIVWPSVTAAQQSALPVIGFLGPGSAQSDAYRVAAFRLGLREAGFVEESKTVSSWLRLGPRAITIACRRWPLI